jgi:hypothetical protein
MRLDFSQPFDPKWRIQGAFGMSPPKRNGAVWRTDYARWGGLTVVTPELPAPQALLDLGHRRGVDRIPGKHPGAHGQAIARLTIVYARRFMML